jgi:hypothetical protein
MKYLIKYLVDNFKIDNNTAVTLILTISIFITGFIINWVGGMIKNYLLKRTYRKSMRIIIHDFFSSCKRQLKLFDEVLKQKGLLEGFDFEITYVSNYSQSYLESVDIYTFIKNFYNPLNKKRPKCISKLFEIVSSISTGIINFKEMQQLGNDYYSESENQYNDSLDSIRKIADSFIVKYSGTTLPSGDEGIFIDNYMDIINDWRKAGGSTTKAKTHELIVQPILNLSRNGMPAQYKQSSIDLSLAASRAFVNMKKAETHLKDAVKNISFLYRRANRLGKKTEKNLQ